MRHRDGTQPAARTHLNTPAAATSDRITISLPRAPTQVVLGVLAGAGIVFLILMGLMLLFFGYTPAAPDLLAGLRAGGDYRPCPLPASKVAHPGTGTTSELTSRLGNQFPVGRPSEPIEPYLRSQGFEPSKPCNGFPDHRIAIYRKGSRWASVAWTTDSNGMLRKIQGSIQ